MIHDAYIKELCSHIHTLDMIAHIENNEKLLSLKAVVVEKKPDKKSLNLTDNPIRILLRVFSSTNQFSINPILLVIRKGLRSFNFLKL